MGVYRIVIGYDGSDDARHAIEVAALATAPAHALVVTVWDVVPSVVTAAPLTGGVAAGQAVSAAERVALRKAREGADLARDTGLAPEFAAPAGSGVPGIADALVAAAEGWRADLIVVGRRDMSRLRELVLGSVSDAVVRASPRPVLVVPAAGG